MYFLVMNEFLVIEDSVLVCCWKLDEHRNVEVEYFPQPPEEVAMQIMSSNELKWDRKVVYYQQRKMIEE
jgi:hypothetical protein